MVADDVLVHEVLDGRLRGLARLAGGVTRALLAVADSSAARGELTVLLGPTAGRQHCWTRFPASCDRAPTASSSTVSS